MLFLILRPVDLALQTHIDGQRASEFVCPAQPFSSASF